jgi:hypothetical protein
MRLIGHFMPAEIPDRDQGLQDVGENLHGTPILCITHGQVGGAVSEAFGDGAGARVRQFKTLAPNALYISSSLGVMPVGQEAE